MIIFGLKVAAKCNSETSNFFCEKPWQTNSEKKIHFIEQFQSGFNVCTVWTAENSGNKIYCSLGGILVVSDLKLIL